MQSSMCLITEVVTSVMSDSTTLWTIAHQAPLSSIHLGKRLLLITKNRYPNLMILVFFCVWENVGIWGH